MLRLRSTTRTGFTLLETVIALGVAVVVLAASVSARQYLLRNAQVTEQQTIMVSLINDTFSKLQTTRQASPADFGSQLGTVVTSAYVVPYTLAIGGAPKNVQLKWCQLAPLADVICNGYTTTVRDSSGGGTTIAAFGTNNAEIVAVPTTVTAGAFQLIDFAAYTKDQNASNSLAGKTITAGLPGVGTAGYTYYYRQVMITKAKEAVQKPGFGGDASKQYVYFVAKVTVWPYGANQSAGVTRSTIFADVTGASFQ